MSYTPQQRAQYLLWYIELGSSHPDFKRKMTTELGKNIRIPKKQGLEQWKTKLLSTGTLHNLPHTMPKVTRTTDNIEAVRGMVEENANVSVRQIRNQLGISIGTVHKILTEDLNLYPYKAQVVQELKPGDPEARSSFARQMMGHRLEHPEFPDNLIFFDEALFHVEGVPNRQNYRTWAESNPNIIISESLHPQYVHALMGIGRHGLIGPFFFDGTVTGQRYLDKLRDDVVPALQNWPNRQNLVLVQDGAPAHHSKIARAYLDQQFTNWIGRASKFIAWPARSPDLTPMDFYLWGHLKQKLYRGQVFPNLDVLRERIREEAAQVPLDMIRNALDNFWKRLLICERNGGLSVETRDNYYDELDFNADF